MEASQKIVSNFESPAWIVSKRPFSRPIECRLKLYDGILSLRSEKKKYFEIQIKSLQKASFVMGGGTGMLQVNNKKYHLLFYDYLSAALAPQAGVSASAAGQALGEIPGIVGGVAGVAGSVKYIHEMGSVEDLVKAWEKILMPTGKVTKEANVPIWVVILTVVLILAIVAFWFIISRQG